MVGIDPHKPRALCYRWVSVAAWVSAHCRSASLPAGYDTPLMLAMVARARPVPLAFVATMVSATDSLALL